MVDVQYLRSITTKGSHDFFRWPKPTFEPKQVANPLNWSSGASHPHQETSVWIVCRNSCLRAKVGGSFLQATRVVNTRLGPKIWKKLLKDICRIFLRVHDDKYLQAPWDIHPVVAFVLGTPLPGSAMLQYHIWYVHTTGTSGNATETLHGRL